MARSREVRPRQTSIRSRDDQKISKQRPKALQDWPNDVILPAIKQARGALVFITSPAFAPVVSRLFSKIFRMKYAVVLAFVAMLVLACNPTVEADSADNQEGTCTPGEQFSRDCNTCTCPPSGQRALAMCTLKLCV